MAMMVVLRDRIGNKIVQREIEQRTAFPEITTCEGKYYVIKNVGPGKKMALYVEAEVLDIPGEV
jgi:hypothetical protein